MRKKAKADAKLQRRHQRKHEANLSDSPKLREAELNSPTEPNTLEATRPGPNTYEQGLGNQDE
jgi:hypothetical protein